MMLFSKENDLHRLKVPSNRQLKKIQIQMVQKEKGTKTN